MVQIRRVGIKRLKQILKLEKGGKEMIEHITNNNEEKNNIKCDIEEEKEIFKLLNDYDIYSDVIDYNTLPTMRRKLIMILNKKSTVIVLFLLLVLRRIILHQY